MNVGKSVGAHMAPDQDLGLLCRCDGSTTPNRRGTEWGTLDLIITAYSKQPAAPRFQENRATFWEQTASTSAHEFSPLAQAKAEAAQVHGRKLKIPYEDSHVAMSVLGAIFQTWVLEDKVTYFSTLSLLLNATYTASDGRYDALEPFID